MEGGLKKLCHGLSFNGKPLPPIKVSWQNETKLRFALQNIRPGRSSRSREPWACA